MAGNKHSEKMFVMVLMICLLVILPVRAMASFDQTWDFTTGLDTSNFYFSTNTTAGQQGAVYLDDSGGNLRLYKDTGAGGASGWVGGGVSSNFFVTGNATVIVDFGILAYPGGTPPWQQTVYHGDQLGISFNANSRSFGIVRSNEPTQQNYHAIDTGWWAVWISGSFPTTTWAGKMKLVRDASTGTGYFYFQDAGSSTWTLLASSPDFGSGAFNLLLSINNNQGAGSTYTPMNVYYDNLSITADGVTGFTVVPEPAPLLLLGFGLVGLAGASRGRE